MARRNVFRIEWEGIDTFLKIVDDIQDAFGDILLSEYTRFGNILEEAVKHLIPEDTGDLAASINTKVKRMPGGGVELEVGTNHAYALRRHEEPYRPGRYPKYDNGSKFPNYYVDGRGATTRAKGSYKGYKPGRKYMTNAVKAVQDEYDAMIERIIRRAMGG